MHIRIEACLEPQTKHIVFHRLVRYWSIYHDGDGLLLNKIHTDLSLTFKQNVDPSVKHIANK